MVKLNPLGIYTFTDASGYYEFIVDDGDYTIEYIGSDFAHLLCPLPGTYDVSLSMNGSVSDGNHFYVLRKDYDLCITKNIGNARPGLKQFNCVQACNFSAEAKDAIVTFRHDPLFAQVTPLPNIFPINALAGTYTYDATTFTFTWTLTDLQPGECRKIMWHMEVPQTAMVGDVISSTAKVGPIDGDFNPANNCMDWLLALTGSYDPNDKRNMVGETQWGGAIYSDDETMEYAIRFQNVGNDTAFTVVVRDTIDEAHLDVTTIRGITASHDVEVEFEDSNVLIFRFEDILLVDSFTNEPASNGWVNFSIDRKPGQSFGTEIKNQAAIYFDFNAPVITNELVNTLTNPVSIFSPKKEKIQVKVLPNITNENVLLEFTLEKSSDIEVQIYNEEGLLLKNLNVGKRAIGEYQEELSLKDFPSGIYFIYIKTENGNAVRKVVKM